MRDDREIYMGKRMRFPFAAPASPEPHPKMTECTEDSIHEAIEVIEWFIQVRGRGSSMVSDSPIARWLGNLRRFGSQEPLVAPPEAPDDLKIEFAMADLFHACALAWSIRVLEPRAGKRDYVAKSLVSKELLGRDESEEALPGMPGGFGTIYIGARCLHCGGGAVQLEGKKSRGVDITWWPRGFHDQSLRIVFERKDLAFDRSFHRDADGTATRVCDRLKESSVKLPPKEEGTTRVSIIGLTCAHEVAQDLQQRRLVVNPSAAKASGLEIPDLAVVYSTGMKVVDGDLKVDDFSNVVVIADDIDEQSDPGYAALQKVFSV